MKIIRTLTFAALAVTLLFQIPITRAAAQNNARDNGHKLRLRAYFERYAGPTALDFGDQFTLAGSVARFGRPNEPIGSFVFHAVATAPQGAETMLYGVVNLPDGQISFSGFSPTQEPRIPGPITGGTGAYRGAKGELEHKTLPGGVEEFILTFVGR